LLRGRLPWISSETEDWLRNNRMSSNTAEQLTQTYLEAIETQLQHAVERSKEFGSSRLHEMLAYHMGWKAYRETVVVRGKRIRPLLVLLVCTAAGGDWSLALPGAAAVELIHNFSLIHDDIEDRSPLRRGRPTVWKKWSIPQAINTGDAMFALAHLEAIRLAQTVNPAIGLQAVEILQSTCLHLTQGQYLDLSYETRRDLTVDDYWLMVEGKTAALIAASAELGALAALSDKSVANNYREFGRLLGMAFQVQDDLLGIWGNSSLTGKSSQSDLVTGKITLPIIYGLSRAGEFATRWKRGPIQPAEIPEVINLLETEGGKEFTSTEAARFCHDALSALDELSPAGVAGQALKDLALSLVNRQS
jgi:geranylgeranyl diphosphate synthase type I